MKFVRPVSVIHTAHNLKGGLQLAEFAGHLCYKSEGKTAPGSYVKFLLMLIDKGHTSILEHCPIYVCGYHDMMSIEMINIRHSAFLVLLLILKMQNLILISIISTLIFVLYIMKVLN